MAASSKMHIAMACVFFGFVICNVDSLNKSYDCMYGNTPIQYGTMFTIKRKKESKCDIYFCWNGAILYQTSVCYKDDGCHPLNTKKFFNRTRYICARTREAYGKLTWIPL
ncbi:hypothetical protein PoB_005984100 [Plakobranchus ocellatus]|uniref:Uncharacterized protein n=1 Tax=Plakobranchus ocellatus TaxID=259542 RepID=A0AAV4CK86_9GAST|nr:hypothetical protein PoB_005984100 [Plakobranchus ocellatus]